MGKLQNRVSFPDLCKEAWEVMNDQEQTEWVSSAVSIIRQRGFPYHLMTESACIRMFNDLCCVESSEIIRGNEVRQTHTGSKLGWFYHPHAWEVECGGKYTPENAFSMYLTKVIRKVLNLNKDFNIGSLRSMLKIYSGTQSVSNFRPTAAKAIYDQYAGKGVVWDMCCGYGGRLLGFLASKKGRVYYGTEPCTPTFQGLKALEKDFREKFVPLSLNLDFGKTAVPLNEKKISLHQKCAEDFIPPEMIDLAFTSPPYFDIEKYSEESTQSYLKYEEFPVWLDKFIGGMMDNVLQVLKPNGWFLFNVGGDYLISQVIELAKDEGFTLKKTLKMRLSDMPGINQKQEKSEPILCFKRRRK